jgi:small-conductance mechanosensitive channel
MDFSRPFLPHLVAALAAIPLLFPLCLWLSRRLRKRLEVPFGMRFYLLSLAFSVWLPLRIYAGLIARAAAAVNKAAADVQRVGEPAPLEPFLIPDEVLRGLLAMTIFCGALVLVKVVRKHIWDDWFERTQETEAPKFVGDLCSAAILGASLLLIAWGVYDSNLKDFELGSTVSVAVLGFASQDLLGNLLSGIALQIGSPFRKGDWLLLDQRRLQVQEVNWRSTRMRSSDNVLVDVPNKTVAGGLITNLSAPTPERAFTITIPFDYALDPDAVKACLLRAALASPGVLASPGPRALLREFTETSVLYDLSVWIAEEGQLGDVGDAVRTQVWTTAREAGFALQAMRPPTPK